MSGGRPSSVSADVPDACDLSRVDFNDHVPELLDRLTDRLRGKATSLDSTGRNHGICRWAQGYSIAEVVTELGHLRSTLIRDTFTYGMDQGFDLIQVESLVMTIDNVIDESIAHLGPGIPRLDEETRPSPDLRGRRSQGHRGDRADQAPVADRRPARGDLGLPGRRHGALGQPRSDPPPRARTAESTAAGRGVRPTTQHRGFAPTGRLTRSSEFPIARALRGETVLREDHFWQTRRRDLRHGQRRAAGLGRWVDRRGRPGGAGHHRPEGPRSRARRVGVAVPGDRRAVAGDDLAVGSTRAGATSSTRPGSSSAAGVTTRRPARVGRGDPPRRRGAPPRHVPPGHGGPRKFEIVYRLSRHDGKYRWIADQGTPYYDGSGELPRRPRLGDRYHRAGGAGSASSNSSRSTKAA